MFEVRNLFLALLKRISCAGSDGFQIGNVILQCLRGLSLMGRVEIQLLLSSCKCKLQGIDTLLELIDDLIASLKLLLKRLKDFRLFC